MTAEDKKRLLDLDNVSIVFGGLRAVSNLSMHIDEHELIGLIGPNGAGKTTAFNLITGSTSRQKGISPLMGSASMARNPIRSRSWGWPGLSRTSAFFRSCPSLIM